MRSLEEVKSFMQGALHYADNPEVKSFIAKTVEWIDEEVTALNHDLKKYHLMYKTLEIMNGIAKTVELIDSKDPGYYIKEFWYDGVTDAVLVNFTERKEEK